MNSIIFISKVELSTYPRLIAIPHLLSKLFNTVTIISPGILPNILCKQKNISFAQLSKFPKISNSILGKTRYWIYFRNKVKKILSGRDGEFIWISSADTAIALFGLIFRHNYILQINELYDQHVIYSLFLKKLATKSSANIVPEVNRAHIFKVWFNLDRMPFILPNNSILPFEERNIPEIEEHIVKIKELKKSGVKIILYQGHLSLDRNIGNLIKYLNRIRRKIHLVLMGKDHGMLNEYYKLTNNITYIKHIAPPYHLQITELADIGLLYYDHSSLNNLYCAPNKIWEYSYFGIPMICNDIPGIYEVIKIFKAGIIMEFNSENEFLSIFANFLENLNFYSDNSKKFYESSNLEKILRKIFEQIPFPIK